MKLFKHQQDLLQLNPDKHALVWEVGCGKTIGALSLASQKTKSILIICPKGLVDKWKKDVLDFDIDPLVISKENFKKLHKTLPKYDCVLIDEVHNHLGTKSQLMKSTKWYLEYHDVPFRYFLSGTIYRSSPNDIYVLYTLLGKKLNYWTFQTKFFYQVRMGPRMVPMVKKGIEPEIAQLVHDVGSIVKLEDCIDMPPATYQEELFEMTEEQKEAIKNLEDTNPIVRFTKIHQLMGGTMKGDEYHDDLYVESNKLNRVMELAEEIDRLIIVCRYNNEIQHLIQKLSYLGKRIEFINGSVDNRQELLNSLEKENKYILIVNSACSEGWQLQNCSHMIFYSYDFQLKNYIQISGRLRRIDKPRPVLYISLIVKDTIDESVFQCIKRKEDFLIAVYSKSNV